MRWIARNSSSTGAALLSLNQREEGRSICGCGNRLQRHAKGRCQRIAGLCPDRLGAQIRWHMERGLAYEALGFSRQFRLSEAAAIASRIMVLAGTPGVRRMLAEKLGSA